MVNAINEVDSCANYVLNDTDRRCLDRMRANIPEKLFDMHVHTFRNSLIPEMGKGALWEEGAPEKNFSDIRTFIAAMAPGSKTIRLCSLMIPDRGIKSDPALLKEQDRFLTGDLENNPGDIGFIAVMNDESAESIAGRLRHKRIKGLKCYHVTARRPDTFNADIGEYLSEGAWEAAQDHGLSITLHMVKRNSLSDKGNLSYIREHCKRYPKARLILAHAARGFAPASAIDALDGLEGLPNVYFDAAAVCEPLALIEIVRRFGSERLFWGSDYPVSADRGKCVSVGDYFHWINTAEAKGNSPGGGSYAEDLALVGTENFIAMDYLIKIAKLSLSERDNIYYNNAAALADN